MPRREIKEFGSVAQTNNDDHESDENDHSFYHNYFKTLGILICLAIICGALSMITEIAALFRNHLFNHQLRGQKPFDPDNKGTPGMINGFPGEPISVHPNRPSGRDYYNMKRFLAYPVDLLSRGGAADMIYLGTVALIVFMTIVHSFIICFVEGFRIASRISMAIHMGCAVIGFFIGCLYILWIDNGSITYIRAARAYSRFAHQFDHPLITRDPSECNGLPMCYLDKDPPPPLSPVQWLMFKREAINLEYIFRICAKVAKHGRSEYVNEWEWQESKMFILEEIKINGKVYDFDELNRLGFCENLAWKNVSATCCLLYSIFCLLVSGLIYFNGEEEPDDIDKVMNGGRRSTFHVYGYPALLPATPMTPVYMPDFVSPEGTYYKAGDHECECECDENESSKVRQLNKFSKVDYENIFDY